MAQQMVGMDASAPIGVPEVQVQGAPAESGESPVQSAPTPSVGPSMRQ
jgi:hypothetical protein